MEKITICARVSLGSDLQRRVLEGIDVGGELGDKARGQFALLRNACGEPSGIILDVLRAKLRQIRHGVRVRSNGGL
jgi:hypothetical protein